VLAERPGQAVRILEFDELDRKAFIVMSNHPAAVPGKNDQGVDIGPKPRRDGSAT
jgi:H2-forming N5,N10-methylenetetrahydromethanopterin dehydrogenase-like enzyme